MDISGTVFRRRFALNMYKDMDISLGKMSFTKDFVNDNRGDPYPLRAIEKGAEEKVEKGVYSVWGGFSERFFCSFFPYASYELEKDAENGCAGFVFSVEGGEVRILFSQSAVRFICGDREQCTFVSCSSPATYSVACHPGAFDIYLKNGGN